MTESLHPEGLFDLERQASLTESERSLRDRHLASCAACRLEHGFRSDFAREALEGEDDRRLLERAVHGALATVTLPPPPRRTARWAVPGVIGAGLLAAGLAAAALHGERATSTPSEASAAPLADLPVVVPSASSPEEPARVEPPAPAPDLVPERPRVAALSAAPLFARANAERRAGNVAEALRLYRRLLAEFSTSREARTSEVTMARLLLDTQGDAEEALRLFERYVQAAPSGNLAEEALLGRAEALGRLARSAEETRAWSALVETFPTTVHRARAEARVREIAAASP